jgi:hypothetical protein
MTDTGVEAGVFFIVFGARISRPVHQISNQQNPITNLEYPFAMAGYRKGIFQIGDWRYWRWLIMADCGFQPAVLIDSSIESGR